MDSAEKNNDLSGPSSYKLYGTSLDRSNFSQNSLTQNDEYPNNKVNQNGQIKPSLMGSNNINSEIARQNPLSEFSSYDRTNDYYSNDECNQCSKLFNFFFAVMFLIVIAVL